MTDYGKFGGDGGEFFDDVTIPNMGQLEIGEVTIRSGDVVDSLEVLYRNPKTGELVPTAHHGGYGGTQYNIILAPGEYIVEIRGRTGGKVDALTFQTNLGRRFGRYGGTGGDTDYDAPSTTVVSKGEERDDVCRDSDEQ